MQINRRQFIRTTAVAAAAAVTLDMNAAEKAAGVNWPIGCFNRPWTKWSYENALDGIKDAGYKITGLLTTTREDKFIAADADPAYLAALKKRIAGKGLIANMGALRVKTDGTVDDGPQAARCQMMVPSLTLHSLSRLFRKSSG